VFNIIYVLARPNIVLINGKIFLAEGVHKSYMRRKQVGKEKNHPIVFVINLSLMGKNENESITGAKIENNQPVARLIYHWIYTTQNHLPPHKAQLLYTYIYIYGPDPLDVHHKSLPFADFRMAKQQLLCSMPFFCVHHKD
jgi:hypothetical protein